MPFELRHTDKIAAVLLVALSAGVFVATRSFPEGPNVTGPAFFPRVIAALLALFALAQLAASFAREGVRAHEITLPATKRVAIPGLLVVAYVLTMPYLGFLLGTVAFLVVGMRYSGVRAYRRSLPVAVGLTLLLFYTFVVFLRVPLPANPFVPIYRLLPALAVGVVGW